MTNERQRETFKGHMDLDFSYEITGLARYRVNAHMSRTGIGLAMRAIKTKVLPLAELNLPEVISG